MENYMNSVDSALATPLGQKLGIERPYDTTQVDNTKLSPRDYQAYMNSGFNDQAYKNLVGPENQRIMQENQAKLDKFNIYNGLSKEEQAGLNAILDQDIDLNEVFNILVDTSKNKKLKEQLANAGRIKIAQHNRTIDGEILLTNKIGIDMDEIKDRVSQVNKQIGDTGTIEDYKNAANTLSSVLKENIVAQGKNFFIQDVNGKFHPIEPGFWNDMATEFAPIASAIGFETFAVGKVGAKLGVGILNPMKKGQLLWFGGAKAANFARSATTLGLAGAIGGVAGEALNYENAFGTFMQNPIDNMYALFGFDKEKAKWDRANEIRTALGYKDYTQDIVTGGATGAIGNVAILGATRAAGLAYRGSIATSNAIGTARQLSKGAMSSVKDNSQNTFAIQNKLKERAKKVFTSADKRMNEQLEESLDNALKDFKVDENLSFNNNLAKARAILKETGYNVDLWSDDDVYFYFATQNKNLMEALNSKINAFAPKQKQQLRTNIEDITDARIDAFKKTMDQKAFESQENLLARIDNYENVKHSAKTLSYNIADKYKSINTTIPDNVYRNLQYIYKTKNGQIDSFYESLSKDLVNSSRAEGTLRPSLNLALFKTSPQSVLPNRKPQLTTNVADLLLLRAELGVNAKEIISNSSGKLSQKDIKQMQNSITKTLLKIKDPALPELNKSIFRAVQQLNDISRYIRDYETLGRVFTNANALANPKGLNKETILANITEKLIQNKGQLTDLETFSRMLSKPNASKAEIAETSSLLQQHMVKTLVNKNLGSKKASDIKNILDWLETNQKHLTDPKAKQLANYAYNFSVQQNNFDNLVNSINLAASDKTKIGTALSAKFWHPVAVYANSLRLKAFGSFIDRILGQDEALHKYMAVRLANFIANPVDARQVNSIQEGLTKGVASGSIPKDQALQVAEAAASYSVQTKHMQDFIKKIYEGKLDNFDIKQLEGMDETSLQSVIIQMMQSGAVK